MAPHQKDVPDDVSTSYSNETTEPTKTASPVTSLKHRHRHLQKESGLKDKRRFQLLRFLSTRNLFPESEKKLVRLPASRNLVSDSEKSPTLVDVWNQWCDEADL
jgi:hypothetical protein